MSTVLWFIALLVSSVSASAASTEFAAGRNGGETPAAIASGPADSVYVAGVAEVRESGQQIYVTRIEAGGTHRTFTAHLSGSTGAQVRAIAVDRWGNSYLTGRTSSPSFPTFGVESRRGGAADGFLVKLDPKGNWLYSTVFGGSGNDVPNAITVDGAGQVYITGITASRDFVAGEGPAEVNAFVAKFRNGERVVGQLFPGTGNAIALDSEGAMYIAGNTGERTTDAFLLKIDLHGERVYRSALPDHSATAVAVAADGVAWVAGFTTSDRNRDASLARFDADGNRTLLRTFGGAAEDEAHDIALDSQRNVYLAGITRSSDFPTLDSKSSVKPGAFLLKLSPDGERTFRSEVLANSASVQHPRMAIDRNGNAILTGESLQSIATCEYRLSQVLHSAGTAGGEDTILVDTSEECGWNPESSAPWIAVARLSDRFEVHVAPNYLGPRGGSVAVGGQTLFIVQSGKADASRAAITGAIRANAGFQTSQLIACDDSCSSAAVNLGFSINFFGTSYTQVYVNNNGNVSFAAANSSYSPNPIKDIRFVMIAPFWADVDTSSAASGRTKYGTDLIDGRKAFGVNWVDVGYFSGRTDKLNSFQLVLIDRNDLGAGFFDIEMNYGSVQWETGSASGGTNGLGGNSARAGFSNGSGTAGTYFELPGSGANGALLNGGANSLVSNSTNSGGVAGRYVYNVRAGSVVCGYGISPTSASAPAAGVSVPVTVTVSNSSCTWNVTGLPTWITSTTNITPTAQTATLAVAANTGAARTATFSIAGQTFVLTQAAGGTTTTCPPVSFSHGTDLSLLSGTLSQGSLAGLERLLDGSFTLHNFFGNTTNFTQTSTPGYQQNLNSCIGRPALTPTPPLNYQLLSEQRGTSALNPMVTTLGPAGTSSSVGVGAYSLDSARMQVWNSTASKTPGTKANYDVPANPQKLMSADLNNDNKKDVVLISQGATGGTQGVLSSFPGNGDGTLGARRDVNVGNNPQSATLYDFDNDAKLDAAVANTGSNNVMFLKGNGDVSFQQPVTLAGDAAGPKAISAADLNKDNKGDLIIGHNNGVDVRFGNGNGTFQPPVRLASGFVATSVGSGDFNRDGNPDVAVSSEGSSSATIILGNGNGTFRTPTSYVTRANAGPFFVTDFDSDGNSDMVFGAGHPDGLVAANGDTGISVIYGRADGTLFGSSSAVLPSLGGLAAGDFNGDGRPDVAATAPFLNSTPVSGDRKAPSFDTPNTAGLYLALNNGQGSLQPPSSTPVPSQGGVQLSKITGGDFNGDNRRDVAVTSGSNIYVLLGNGFGGFSAPNTVAGSSQITAITAADLNGDYKQDLIFTDDNEDRVSVAIGNGNGTFQNRTPLIVGTDPKDVAVADVNGDGRPDLIVVNYGTAGNDGIPGGISILLGNGNGTFQSATNFTAGLHPTNVTVGDINLDGKPDLVVSTGGPNSTTVVALLLGNGNGTFQTATTIPVAFGPGQTALTDFNADGKVDIIVGHCCGEVQMGVLLGNGNGTFQSETGIANTGRGSSYVTVLDVNNDAKPDIVFGANTPTGGFVATLLNTTTSAAPSVCTFAVSQNSYSVGTAAQTLTGTITASAPSCSFNASSNQTWVTVTPTFGQGQTATTYTLSIQANLGVARSASISIGGQTITVSQAAPACPYGLSPSTLSPPPAGGSFTINVASSAGCNWQISGVPSWVTVTSPGSLASSGTGAISLNVAANAGPARIATLTIAGQSYLITQAGIGPAGGLRFSAIEPCRLVETRSEYNFEGRTGSFGPPFFNANDTRTFVPSASNVCRTIPANAKAFVLNVTLVPRGGVDFVTVYPAGETRPDFWTVRSLDGLIVANSAIVAAGTGGGISVFASNTTDIIIDINGFFTDDPAVSNLIYYPLTPCRVIETRIDYRTSPGPFGPQTMAARETRNFRFPDGPYCTVPKGAAAYAATITVVPPASLAFLTAWPEGRPQPNVSSTNSPAGRIVANSVIVPASPDGGIQLFTLDRSDVIVDITGYFGPDDGSSGMFYFPVRQCRISQTNGTGFTGVFGGPIFENETTRTIPIPQSTCAGIPGNARAYSLNATVMPGGSPMPFLTIYPTGQGQPNASVINAFEGQTVSSGFLVPAGTNGAVNIFAYRRTHIALEISGYFGR